MALETAENCGARIEGTVPDTLPVGVTWRQRERFRPCVIAQPMLYIPAVFGPADIRHGLTSCAESPFAGTAARSYRKSPRVAGFRLTGELRRMARPAGFGACILPLNHGR